MNTNECEILGEYLKSNHTLMGLHIIGNDGKVDIRGFLQPFQVPKLIKE